MGRGGSEVTAAGKGRRFASIWDAIEDDPQEAHSLKLRSRLMMLLQERIKGERMTQAKAAKALGVTQPRVSELLRGKIDRFALDDLVSMSTHLGLTVELIVTRPAATASPAKSRRAAACR